MNSICVRLMEENSSPLEKIPSKLLTAQSLRPKEGYDVHADVKKRLIKAKNDGNNQR